MIKAHRRQAMRGRDPHEPNRVATPMELLYDLIFVVAIGVTSAHFADALAAGHLVPGLAAFALCMVATLLAWMGFAWFASAYDTDDWVYRLFALVQMVGVTLLALGVPDVFASVQEGGHLRLETVVAGFVVMRIALLAQHLRAARNDPGRRPVLLRFVAGWALAQVGWVALIFVPTPLPWVFCWMIPLYVIEIAVPWYAERQGTLPWHAHHIAERYSLLTIITLGEVVVGTVNALSVLIADRRWTVDDIALMIAGVAIAMGLWWVYFVMPLGEALNTRRRAAVWFNWVHFALFMSTAAVGAGLRVVAVAVAPDQSAVPVRIGPVAAVMTVAIPLLAFVVLVNVLYRVLLPTTGEHDRFHLLLIAATTLVLALSVGVVAAGASPLAGLAVAALAPAVTVVGYELRAHAMMAADLQRAEQRS